MWQKVTLPIPPLLNSISPVTSSFSSDFPLLLPIIKRCLQRLLKGGGFPSFSQRLIISGTPINSASFHFELLAQLKLLSKLPSTSFWEGTDEFLSKVSRPTFLSRTSGPLSAFSTFVVGKKVSKIWEFN